MNETPILQISATVNGVAKVTLACSRKRDEIRLYEAVAPAIEIIDRAVRERYETDPRPEI